MKKIGIITVLLLFLGVYLFYSCKKTSSTSSSSSTTTSAVASPSVNTSISIGGAGWSFNGCAVGGPTLTAILGSTTVELAFGSTSPIISGVYSMTQGSPLSGQVRLKIIDPPGQPIGYQWYSSLGSQTVAVTTSTVGSVATFSNITCTQTSTANPVVTASGTIACQ